MRKSIQGIQVNQYIPVKKEFTSKTTYKRLAKTAERREIVLQEFIAFVKAQEKNIRDNCGSLNDRDYLIFNDYISDAFDMLNQCWGGEMIKLCNQRLKVLQDFLHNPEFQESLPLEFTQYESDKFESMQQQLFEQIKQQQNQIEVFMQTTDKFQQDRQKTLNYFNPNFLRQPYVQLSKLYHFIQQSNHKNKKLINKLQKSKIKFLSVFGNFRKIAVRNRILYQKKFYKMCNSMIDVIVKTFHVQFSKLKKVKEALKEDSILSQDKQRYDFFNKATSEDIFSICNCVRDIYSSIYNILKISKQERAKFNQKICDLLKVQDSIPSHAINFVLETFQKMLGRYTQIANNLYEKVKFLQKQEPKMNDVSTNYSNYQSGIRRTKVSAIQKTLTVHGIIHEIIDEMIDPISKLVAWSEGPLAKDRKIYLDDQNLHHDMTRLSIEDGNQQVHEQDVWMFEDWKSPNSIKPNSIDKIKEELSKMKSLIESQKKSEGKQIMQAQKCHLTVSPSYDKKGIFYTYQNCVKFVSSEDNQLLIIPYESINNIKVKLQGFKLNMFLYTPRGRIMFLNPPRAIKCKQKISERLKIINNNNNDSDGVQDNADDLRNAKGNIMKWKSIQLSPEELTTIQSRKSKILAQLPDVSTWSQTHPNHVFKNITIDQLFNELFSDTPKQVSGKKWDSFNCYLLNTLGNNKIQDGKFTQKGPKFYMQQDGQTFQNCPSFSERINNYQHALEGFPIPFLPKFCQCKQVVKIYWISHEQFAIALDGYSSGVPMTDAFYVRMLQHAKKSGNDVEISYRGTVVFIKQTSFKSILQKKCLQQVKDNLPKTIKIQEARLKYVLASAKGQAQPSQQPVEQAKQSINTPTNSLANNNMMVIVFGVIGFLILIKILKMMLL